MSDDQHHVVKGMKMGLGFLLLVAVVVVACLAGIGGCVALMSSAA